MKINYYETLLKKIKVNVFSDGFWVVPNDTRIFTPKQSNFSIKKASSIEEVIKYNNLTEGSYYFSFNQDHDFKLFNKLLKISDFNFQITKQVLNEIEKEGYKDFEVNEFIKIRIDQKALFYIYKGFSFFINEEYLKTLVKHYQEKNQVHDLYIFVWRKKAFELIKK